MADWSRIRDNTPWAAPYIDYNDTLVRITSGIFRTFRIGGFFIH
jgi:hypothetical protein